jgi:precorrin-2 dehydrogenase/sirohydrochlorin ferrochelatase
LARRSVRKPLYPIFLDLNGAAVLVVGGGNVAARKVPALLDAGARVTVIAPEIDATIVRATRRADKRLRLLRRMFRSSDIRKHKLIFAATSNNAVNTCVAAAARRAGIPVNVAAPPDAGDVQIPSVVRRGSLCVAVSTGGASAALAAAWRQKLERLIGPEWSDWVGELERVRARVLRVIPSESARRNLLQKLGDLSWARAVKSKGLVQVRRELNKLIRLHSQSPRSKK